jgi:hypothetical protein
MATMPSSLAPVRDVMNLIYRSRISRSPAGEILLWVYRRGALSPTTVPADDQTAALVRWLDRQRRLWWATSTQGDAPRLTKTAERLRGRWMRCWPDDREKQQQAAVDARLRSIGLLRGETVLTLRPTPIGNEDQAPAKPPRRRGRRRTT